MKKIYLCSDTVEGILSAIYDAWPCGKRGEDCSIMLRGTEEPMLFCEFQDVAETAAKARAVERMIRKNLGDSVYRDLYYAMLSTADDKAEAVLGTMLEARKLSDCTRIMEHLSHPMTERTFELSRTVGKEVHNLQGFLRFRLLETGVLYAPITPKAQVLTCLAPHFENRMPEENWMIHDRTHHMFAVHEAGKRWVMVSEEQEMVEEERFRDVSLEEEAYAKMWQGFCRSISIAERENPECQRQNLPLWYRPNMTEFQ